MADSPRVVFCNAGPLIALAKLNRLSLLSQLYPDLVIPRTVYREAVSEGLALGVSDSFATRLFVARYPCLILDTSAEVLRAFEPLTGLDPGETELLALAGPAGADLVLMDDEKARGEARRLGFTVKGTLGVLVEAYRSDLLLFAEVELLLIAIASRPDIWISEKLCEQVLTELRRAG